MAILRALFPHAAFMPKQKAVYTSVEIQSKTLNSKLPALVDSNATENFISPKVIKHFSILTQELPNPKTICNVDGTKNSIREVTHIAFFKICHQNKLDTYCTYSSI